MDFFTAIKTVFAKYATFSGRAPRAEFWFFCLFTFLGGLITAVLDAALFPEQQLLSPLNTIFTLVTLVPAISCTARRLHDIDKSGWWQLLWFLPIIGWIIVIVWMCTNSTPGDNRFGPHPYGQLSPAALA
jgi:uncharacterized membrane protein YhaH (DUF805 family)